MPFGWQIPLGALSQLLVCGRLSSHCDNIHCHRPAACHHLQLLCQCTQCNRREWLCWQQCSTDHHHQGSVWSNPSLTVKWLYCTVQRHYSPYQNSLLCLEVWHFSFCPSLQRGKNLKMSPQMMTHWVSLLSQLPKKALKGSWNCYLHSS